MQFSNFLSFKRNSKSLLKKPLVCFHLFKFATTDEVSALFTGTFLNACLTLALSRTGSYFIRVSAGSSKLNVMLFNVKTQHF